MAALSAWHESHEAAARAIEQVSALPAHAMVESYSVLTRLPGGLAVPRGAASEVLESRFPDAPLSLSAARRGGMLGTLARAGVSGGATYDGLIALEALAHDQQIVTLDARAAETYRRLSVPFVTL